jgi:hypothetical protein
LVRASWAVLLRHRSLLVYPLLSSVVVGTVAGLLPLALVWARLSEEDAAFAFSFRGITGFLVLYLVTCAMVQFFNVALVAEAMARFDGLPRATPRGWSVALSSVPGIVAYAVLASSLVSVPVLVVCRLARLLGIRSLPDPEAWTLATFLGVPILAVERLETRAALERSLAMLRATWGNQFIGGIGVLVVRILVIVGLIVGGLGILLLVGLTNIDVLIVTLFFLWLIALIFVLVTGSAVSTLYAAATYRHLTNQPVRGFEALYELPVTGMAPAPATATLDA